MRALFISLLVFIANTFCTAQKCWSLDQGWIPCSMSDTLKDNLTGNYYVVARSERCIKAFDEKQNILWTTNPWEEKQLSKMHGLQWDGYLNPDSISIHTIDFPKTEYMGGNRSIVVYFSDRIVGSLNKKTGKFTVRGEN
jgi:hypothetical protein